MRPPVPSPLRKCQPRTEQHEGGGEGPPHPGHDTRPADDPVAHGGGEQPAQVLEVLTPREREVFELLVKGDSVKEIAFKEGARGARSGRGSPAAYVASRCSRSKISDSSVSSW